MCCADTWLKWFMPISQTVSVQRGGGDEQKQLLKDTWGSDRPKIYPTQMTEPRETRKVDADFRGLTDPSLHCFLPSIRSSRTFCWHLIETALCTSVCSWWSLTWKGLWDAHSEPRAWAVLSDSRFLIHAAPHFINLPHPSSWVSWFLVLHKHWSSLICGSSGRDCSSLLVAKQESMR